MSKIPTTLHPRVVNNLFSFSKFKESLLKPKGLNVL